MSDKKKTPPAKPKKHSDFSEGRNKGDTAINREKNGIRHVQSITLTTKPPPKPRDK